MKILVCIKQVPESNKVEVDPVTGVLKRDGAASKMNPYDLYALETAFRIREEVGGSVHVISMGPPQAQQVIREAFAMGADGDTAQVGPEISEWLNIPSVADVVKINQIDEDGITVSMDLPEEVEVAKVQFPCLLAVDKDIFQPRLPSYVRKMNTKDREIRILSLADMDDKDAMQYGLNGSPTQVQRIFPPAVNDKKEMWDGSGEELADRLYQKIVDMKFV